MQFELLFNTALMPGAVALLIAWAGARQTRVPALSALAMPFAILVACWLGYRLVSGMPVWWPQRAIEYSLLLPLIPLAAALWPGKMPLKVRSGVFLLAWSGILAAVYLPLAGNWPLTYLAVQWLLPLATVYSLAWQAAQHDKGLDLAMLSPLVLLAPIAGIGGSLLIGQVAGVFASALGATWLLAAVQGKPMGDDWRLLALASAATLAMVAYHYAEVTPLALASIFLPALAFRLGPRAGIGAGWPLWLFTLAIAALSLSTALWWIWPEDSLY